MAQAGKGKLNYRCPRCFMRDIDMDMFFDEQKQEYYCLRCCYHGSESDVLRLNEQFKSKYGALRLRVTDFGKDNEPVKYKPFKNGGRKL